MFVRVLFAVCLVMLVAVAASPQSSEPEEDSLAGLAERNSRDSGKTKVFTDRDLKTTKSRVVIPESATAAEPAGESSADAADGGEDPPEKTEEEQRAELKAEFQAEIQSQREIIAARQKQRDEAEATLSDQGTGPARPAGIANYRGDLLLTVEECDREIA